jgi:hypothetical protein
MSELRTVAALYIDPRGPYPKMPGVDCWDETRDARSYAAGGPVVAHPPCGPWGALKHLSRAPVADCGPLAVEQVRRLGGVLEHPAGSALWAYCLPKPGAVDRFGGFTLEVCQVAWGHVARKRTWVYCVGIDREKATAGVRVGGVPTHWVSGGRNPNRKGSGGLIPPGIKCCSAQQRRRTPPLFAEWLVSLARSSRV